MDPGAGRYAGPVRWPPGREAVGDEEAAGTCSSVGGWGDSAGGSSPPPGGRPSSDQSVTNTLPSETVTLCSASGLDAGGLTTDPFVIEYSCHGSCSGSPRWLRRRPGSLDEYRSW